MNKAAEDDVTFSWMAVGVKDAKTAVNDEEVVVESEEEAAVEESEAAVGEELSKETEI